jgi:hypothetical protein
VTFAAIVNLTAEALRQSATITGPCDRPAGLGRFADQLDFSDESKEAVPGQLVEVPRHSVENLAAGDLEINVVGVGRRCASEASADLRRSCVDVGTSDPRSEMNIPGGQS